MDRNEASALADLQMHWDEAYAIGFDGEIWSARYHGSTDQLLAENSSDLRQLIRADYAERTRPARVAARAAWQAEAAGGGDEEDNAGFAGIRGERMST